MRGARQLHTMRVFRWTCFAVLVVCAGFALVAGRRWPPVGDASLMHYVVFLRQRGLVPYRDIVDINMPGTYVAEALAMRCFGAGALGLRWYDTFLLLAAVGASATFAGKFRGGGSVRD